MIHIYTHSLFAYYGQPLFSVGWGQPSSLCLRLSLTPIVVSRLPHSNTGASDTCALVRWHPNSHLKTIVVGELDQWKILNPTPLEIEPTFSLCLLRFGWSFWLTYRLIYFRKHVQRDLTITRHNKLIKIITWELKAELPRVC